MAAAARADSENGGGREPLVSIVIAAGIAEQGALDRVIASALRQTERRTEIIVVHDGGENSVAETTARCSGLRAVVVGSLGNRAAARNAGLAASHGEYVVFVDPDDALLPAALETGAKCLASDPAAGFAVGSYVRVDDAERAIGDPVLRPQPPDPYGALLLGDHIAHSATVLFRRERLDQLGGFDVEQSLFADWDLYLRAAYRFPVVYHRQVVVTCRRADSGTAAAAMLKMAGAVAVLEKQRRLVPLRGPRLAALRAGLRACRDRFGEEVLSRALCELRCRETRRSGVRGLGFVAREAPLVFVAMPARALRDCVGRGAAAGFAMLPEAARDWVAAQRRKLGLRPPFGCVRFGSLRRLTPISREFGFDRGTPIDRIYIEAFLERHAADIRGRVLEFGDDSYTRRFGGARVTRSDVMSVEPGRPQTTFAGDLGAADHLPGEAFDCVILTQVLQFVYDLHGAVRTVHRILRPGGVVVATMPGTAPMPAEPWTRYWQLTADAAARLFKEQFDTGDIEINVYGNVQIAVAFLHGVAAEELRAGDFDYLDPAYPVIVAVRAVKSAEPLIEGRDDSR